MSTEATDQFALIASLPATLGVPLDATLIQLKREVTVDGESWFIRYQAMSIRTRSPRDGGWEWYPREYTTETFVPRTRKKKGARM